jgi:hypothetical protein
MAPGAGLTPAQRRGPTFADPDLQADLESAGYAVAPVLPAEVAAEVERACVALHPPHSGPMTFANVEADRTFLREVSALVEPLWEEHLLPLVPGHRVAFTTCVIKHPDPWSQMDAHEDGTFVDESDHRAVTMWLSLSDCLPEDRNGMIQVLPRSHEVAGSVAAGANVHEWHRKYRGYLTAHLTPVPTRAGEAGFWDTRLLHGSPANRSQRPRYALAAVLVPERARLIHVEALGWNRRRVFEVDEAFHREHSPTAVRHHVPDGYAVVERRVDPVVDAPVEVIAELCGAAELPEPDRFRPPGDWAARPDALEDRPVAAGSAQLAAQLEALCAAAVVADRSTDGPPRVSTVQGATAAWSEGEWGWAEVQADAQTEASSDDLAGVSQLLVLAPGSAVGFAAEAAGGDEVYLPLVTVGSPAGVATATAEVPFELGLPISASLGSDREVWNASGEEVRCLVIRIPAER